MFIQAIERLPQKHMSLNGVGVHTQNGFIFIHCAAILRAPQAALRQYSVELKIGWLGGASLLKIRNSLCVLVKPKVAHTDKQSTSLILRIFRSSSSQWLDRRSKVPL